MRRQFGRGRSRRRPDGHRGAYETGRLAVFTLVIIVLVIVLLRLLGLF